MITQWMNKENKKDKLIYSTHFTSFLCHKAQRGGRMWYTSVDTQYIVINNACLRLSTDVTSKECPGYLQDKLKFHYLKNMKEFQAYIQLDHLWSSLNFHPSLVQAKRTIRESGWGVLHTFPSGGQWGKNRAHTCEPIFHWMGHFSPVEQLYFQAYLASVWVWNDPKPANCISVSPDRIVTGF